MAELTPGDHFFQADNDIRFHYKARGTGPVFVAQSVGWGPSAAYLWNLLGPLEAHFTMIYFEPRGSGTSSRPSDETRMSSTTMAHDLEHLRTHLALPSFPVLFGHSNGGCIALTYASLFPHRVARLILADAEILGGPPRARATAHWAAFAQKRKAHPVYGPALQALMGAATAPPQTDEAFAQLMDKILPYYFNDTSLAPKLRAAMGADETPPRAWAFLRQGKLDRENPFPHLEEAGKVTARTLLVWGRDDAMCSLQRAEALKGGIKGAELVVLEDCGHFPMVEKPEGFWGAVNGFLFG